jgi:hypothetical protein
MGAAEYFNEDFPMLRHVPRLALAAAVVVLIAPGADAQSRSERIQRVCAKTKDKVRCTCLLENGGRFDRVPGATRYKIYLRNDDSDRFIACMRRSGRPNG